MKKYRLFRFTIVFVLIAILLCPSSLMSYSTTAASAIPNLTPNTLTSSLKIGIKSVLNERVKDETRIGVVVYLYNKGTKKITVPSYELRVVTTDGVTYTLQPSIDNTKTIEPKETVELSYMTVLKRKDSFSLLKLHFVSVDEYVYPKKETILSTIQIKGMEWAGSGSLIKNASRSIDWGKTFNITGASTDLVYKAVQYWPYSTSEGTDIVIVLQVQNNGKKKEWIPDFTLEGRSSTDVYQGTNLESGSLSVESGATRNLHFVVSIPAEEVLSQLTVLTPESFAVNDKSTISYSIGNVQLVLPQKPVPTRWNTRTYHLADSIQVDGSFYGVGSTIDVSIVELHRYREEDSSHQMAVVKLQMTNKSERPVFVPNLDVELMTSSNIRYTGSKQKGSRVMLLPNLSYVYEYAFQIPSSVTGDKVTVNLLQKPNGFSYALPIASLSASWQKNVNSLYRTFTFYPFTLKVNYWSTDYSVSGNDQTFKLTLDLDIERRDNVVIDENSKGILFELVDANNRIVGISQQKLEGSKRLSSGNHVIIFDSVKVEQLKKPITLNIYETLETTDGEINRLVGTLVP